MTKTNTDPALLPQELAELRKNLPLLEKILLLLQSQNTQVTDKAMFVDDRTGYLDLQLPHIANQLQMDLPRLRKSLALLDTYAEKTDSLAAGLETSKATREELQTAFNRAEENRVESYRVLSGALATESATRGQENNVQKEALASHNADDAAHDALIRRVTVGDLSPVIGVCQVQSGNYTGLWAHCDAEGQPVSPNSRYFDYHPIYSNMKRVLVDGQVMIEIPAFWYRHFVATRGPFAGKWCKVISPVPVDGFHLYPAFRSVTGAALSKIYIGAYAATNEGGNPVQLGSRPGKFPHVNANIGTMAEQCANRNVGGVSGFHMWDIYDLNLLYILFLIEFAHTDSQAVMGRGWVDSTAAVRTDDENQCYWRGFYGLFGNVWQFVDGIRLAPNRQIELFRNDGSRQWVNTGKLAPSYDGTNVTRITSLHTGRGNGFDYDDLLLPATHSTNHAEGMYPDNFWGGWASAGNICIIGGDWPQSSGAGLFCLNYHGTSAQTWPNVGCRSAKR